MTSDGGTTGLGEPGPTVADAVKGNWVDRRAPDGLKPYLRLARLDRPIGWWLLMWPCWWSTALVAVAAGLPYPDPWHLFLFFVGAVAMRGAGSTWNDIVDRKVDAQVARTRHRPVASGQVSVKQALAFAVFQSLVGLAVVLQFNLFTILLSFASLLIVAIYPFMKRFIALPQTVFALTFAWGALVGWSATTGSLAAAPIVLYIGVWFWGLGYDTIYGHQDKADDAIIGIKSSSLFFADKTKPALVGIFGATVICAGLSAWLAGGGAMSFLGVAAFAAHLAWQVWRLDANAPDVCLMLFRSNRYAGALLFAGFALDAMLG
ncbi:4-hydroxybenzoate octaprenyltransferase [Lutibaculum baratangense]|uniref:4-hydroxybenzoate octaprenyltransferase n=1 Tax=Lutibaculum baratangense AMV1 TaxID=631454 RepID=V4R8S9_9HYPH|nr:4-hydroxybenzoate octaprenyltransferase [Lutibaculum baratangense]ESR22586.1 4-hydroxybenzoate polyprenyltransferase [Lutibaculum baratangense AMV1]